MATGDKIKRYRVSNKWTQEELAKKMGFKSKVSISHYESGKAQASKEIIERFAKVFDISPFDLVDWSDPTLIGVNWNTNQKKKFSSDPELLDTFMQITNDPSKREILEKVKDLDTDQAELVCKMVTMLSDSNRK